MMRMANTEFELLEKFFTPEESSHHLQKLTQNIAWTQKTIKIFGRNILEPRLTAWYGDANAVYTYSGTRMTPLPWTKELHEIKKKIEPVSRTTFNSVLLNLYRDEHDSMGYHSDDEKELGPEPIIASVSFGAARRFVIKLRKAQAAAAETLLLGSGSLLIMRGQAQNLYKHAIPKESRPCGLRLNLTFRTIVKIP